MDGSMGWGRKQDWATPDGSWLILDSVFKDHIFREPCAMPGIEPRLITFKASALAAQVLGIIVCWYMV